MLKEIFTYEDFDGKPVVETLYFNITRVQLADNMHLAKRFQHLAEIFDGPQRELTQEEALDLLDLVKTIVKLSYGERSEDGKQHIKTEEAWLRFEQSAAYDEYLFSLFDNPKKAIEFLKGVFPRKLMEQALAEAGAVDTPEKKLDYTDAELLAMSQAEFDKVVGTDPLKMTQRQLQLAYQRKNAA